MVKAYSKRKASKFSTAKRMKCMLNAGVVATFDEDFDQVDEFLLTGVLNAVGRSGGKASKENIVKKILCRDEIRNVGTDWINKERKKVELSRKRVLQAYACRFRARIGNSPLARFQRSMFGVLRSPKGKVTMERVDINNILGEGDGQNAEQTEMESDDMTPQLIVDEFGDFEDQSTATDAQQKETPVSGEHRKEQNVLLKWTEDENDSDFDGESTENESNDDEPEMNYTSLDPWEVKEMRSVYSRDTEIKMKKQVEEDCKDMIPRNLPAFPDDLIA